MYVRDAHDRATGLEKVNSRIYETLTVTRIIPRALQRSTTEQLVCLLVLTIGCTARESDYIHIGSAQQLLKHDLGLMMLGTTKVATFEIKNSSTKDWNIAEVTTQCACTVISGHVDHIAAGQTVDFRVEYSARVSGDDQQLVLIRFVELDIPEMHLVVAAQVRPEIDFTPSALRFTSISVNEPKIQTRAVRVTTFTDNPSVSYAVASNAPWVTAHLEKVSSLDKGERAKNGKYEHNFQIEVNVDSAKLPPGLNKAAIKLFEQSMVATNGKDPAQSKGGLPIDLLVRAPFKMSPDSLFFGSDEGESSSHRSVTIRCISSEDCEQCVAEVESKTDAAHVVHVEKVSERCWRITCRIDWHKVVGFLETNVVCRFGDKLPQLKIPLVAFRQVK